MLLSLSLATAQGRHLCNPISLQKKCCQLSLQGLLAIQCTFLIPIAPHKLRVLAPTFRKISLDLAGLLRDKLALSQLFLLLTYSPYAGDPQKLNSVPNEERTA